MHTLSSPELKHVKINICKLYQNSAAEKINCYNQKHSQKIFNTNTKQKRIRSCRCPIHITSFSQLEVYSFALINIYRHNPPLNTPTSTPRNFDLHHMIESASNIHTQNDYKTEPFLSYTCATSWCQLRHKGVLSNLS